MTDKPITASEKALRRASFIASLRDGWLDGGGKGASQENIDCLISLIEDYPILFEDTQIFPMEDGGISIEHCTAPLGFCIEIHDGRAASEALLDYDSMPAGGPSDIVRHMFADADFETYQNIRVRLHHDVPLIIEVDSPLGRLLGMALPEEEAKAEGRYVFSRFTAKTKAALENGSICVRRAMLKASTINLFGGAYPGIQTSRILQDPPEEWMLPEPDLILRPYRGK